MTKDRVREFLINTAHEFNSTLGQWIFTTASLLMLLGSVLASPVIYFTTMFTALSLSWIFRQDLRS